MYKRNKDVFKVPESLPLSVSSRKKTVKSITNSPISPINHNYLLQSDDSLFLNVKVDTATLPICDNDSSISSFESPELNNLNRALIVPNSSKRKSEEGIASKCKRRLLDTYSFEEISVTDSEIWQVNVDEDNSINSIDQVSTQDPQLYFSSQFQEAKEIADSTTIESQIKRNTVHPRELTLTQIFDDDFEEVIEGFVDPCNQIKSSQSQMFLEVAKTISQLPRHPSQKLDELNGTTYKSENSSTYVQLQRLMQVENEDNVNDDNFVDPELSQAMKSTQYRNEIEADFNKCEEAICNTQNIDDSIRSVNMNDATFNLQGINWNSPFPERTPPSSIVKRKLAEFSRKKDFLLKDQTMSTPIKSTNFSSMGTFFDLPTKVQSLIKEYKGIDKLYDWQNECLTLPAVSLRSNLIYALPTSGGKTLVAEILILREIICRRSSCLFILPYVSIVQEKIWAMSPFAVQLDFLLEEYAAGKGQLPPRKRLKKKSLYIATIEKGLALLDSLIEAGRAKELGLIVVDELHIIGEPGRGATLETLLTKAMFINGIQIVGMSATIGNLNEIATFLNADVYTRDFRPVELKEYIKCGSDILAVNPTAQCSDEAFTHVRTVDYGYNDEVLRIDPDHLGGLVSEIIPDESCLVFCSSKQNCENVALLLCRVLPETSVTHRQNQRNALKEALRSDTGAICPVLSQTIPYGIAYHHSGLTTDERRHLENAFRENLISVICCTSTLAAGVNLPAKRVIIRSPYIGRDFLTLSRYKQMVGRAGRAGMGDCGESITIFQPKDHLRMIQLLTAPMDEAASGLHLNDCKVLKSLIVSSIGLSITSCYSDLYDLVSKTLLAVQSERLGLNLTEVIKKTIKALFSSKAVTTPLSTSPQNSSNNDILSTSDTSVVIEDESAVGDSKNKRIRNVVLKPTTKLMINNLGKASFKSCIDLQKSEVLYNDLKQAQKSLVLSDSLHLLYIVTPYEPMDINMTIDMKVYYTQYTRLTPVQMQTAEALGITESCAIRMVTGQSFKPSMSRIVHRFFLTLILHELWQQKSIHYVAEMFHVNRGVIQNLAVAAASYASSVVRFCEELEEFWPSKLLLGAMVKQLSYCCTVELLPLMDLPCVKVSRARQLYSNGFRCLEDVAKSTVGELVEKIEYMSHRVAKQLISAAKVLLLERLETLRSEVEDCLEGLSSRKDALNEF